VTCGFRRRRVETKKGPPVEGAPFMIGALMPVDKPVATQVGGSPPLVIARMLARELMQTAKLK